MDDQNVREIVRLAPSMAHRIRSELSAAQNAADFLISDELISADIREKLSLLKALVGHASALARQFIIITKSEERHLEVIKPHEFISDLAPLFQRLVGEDIHLALELDPNLWPIKVPSDQLEDSLVCLVVNARAAMPDGGALKIRGANFTGTPINGDEATPADYVCIEIKDIGVGISEF